jgi:hypothetical protein
VRQGLMKFLSSNGGKHVSTSWFGFSHLIFCSFFITVVQKHFYVIIMVYCDVVLTLKG